MAIPVTVVGAGAFGGWTALQLLRAGCRVTLLDAWGPGHSRASSGDETRVIRAAYGPNAVYTEMVARSVPVWREHGQRWGVTLFEPAGALWTAGPADDSYERASSENISQAGMRCEEMSAPAAAQRWPQMNWDGIAWAIYEPDAGFLFARRACQAVVAGFIAEGGVYRREAEVTPASVMQRPDDHVVFACGPWLGALFPDALGGLITPTRQEVFYFGTPPGDTRYDAGTFPAWVDNSATRFYGIPGNDGRGFKVAEDVAGPVFDPTSGDRRISSAGLERARAYLTHRFPALADAPVAESRVCQYEMTPDGDLILDRLPGADNVWIAGGGSGHGFKLGPAVGELVARMVIGKADVDPRFGLARLSGRAAGGTIGERK